MDPLSDVLTLLNISAAYSTRLEAGGQWALSFKGYQHAKIGAVLAGSCWYTAQDSPPVRLGAGDCFILASGRPYQFSGDLDTAPVDGYPVYAAAGSATIHYGSDPHSPDRTIMVGGNVNFDDTTAMLLLDVLPPIVRIDAASRSAEIVRPVLQMLGEEIAASAPGTAVMAEHLTRILFIQALRALLADCGEAVPGWLGALNDPQIGSALTLMHQQARRHWTVADLATAVGMSRSAFSLRFKEKVGLPPLEYLLRWRIRAAARALRSGDRTVASVAAESGYASESAFSKAFKRVTGEPPARYGEKAPSVSAGDPA